MKKTIPITRPTLEAFNAYQPYFKKSMSSGLLTYNATMHEFEEKIAQYLGVKYAVAVSSCTSGLVLAMRGLGLKGEVIMPSFTFAASGLPVVWNNLTPVFVDIDANTFTIDVAKIESLITKKTSAIFATHVFGVPCNVIALQKLAKKHNLKLIFDAAHAFGSEHKGKKVGQFGDVEVFSLSPTKVLTAGEGGLVTTNDKKLAEYVRQGRNYGDDGNSTVPYAGLSARMSELHAAVGIVSLKSLNKNLKRRISQAEYFKKELLKIEPRLEFQVIPDSVKTNYKDLSVRIRLDVLGYTREQLQTYFTSKGVMTRSYFHPALHTFATYAPQKKPWVPVTDTVSSEALSLPLYSHITKDDIDYVLRAFKKFTHDRKKS